MYVSIGIHWRVTVFMWMGCNSWRTPHLATLKVACSYIGKNNHPSQGNSGRPISQPWQVHTMCQVHRAHQKFLAPVGTGCFTQVPGCAHQEHQNVPRYTNEIEHVVGGINQWAGDWGIHSEGGYRRPRPSEDQVPSEHGQCQEPIWCLATHCTCHLCNSAWRSLVPNLYWFSS